MTDKQQAHFDSSADNWDSKAGGMNKKAFDHILSRFPADTWADKDVLDYGCGTGLLSFALASHAKYVTGVDVSDGMLNKFREKIAAGTRSNVECRHLSLDGDADLVKLVEGRKYDVITCLYVLHHVADVKATLDGLVACLKPGGRIMICEFPPNSSSESDKDYHTATEGAEQSEGFSPQNLVRLFEGYGLTEAEAKVAFSAEVSKDDHDHHHHDDGEGHDHHHHGEGHHHDHHHHGEGHDHHHHGEGHDHHQHGEGHDHHHHHHGEGEGHKHHHGSKHPSGVWTPRGTHVIYQTVFGTAVKK